jgi:hypothetical protein
MRTAVITGLFAACTLAVWATPAPAAQPAKEPLVEQVRRAITDGVSFLRNKQDNRGTWENEAVTFTKLQGGLTSLALLGLLNAGVKPDDPAVQRGLAYLRTVPPESTYVVGLQTMVFEQAGEKRDLERIEANVKWLIAARVMDGGKLRGWSYKQGGTPDNSNTQYALLGLHAGKAAGVQIPRDVWESIRDYYVRTQTAQGGWSYQANGPASLTMTTAGLCGLLISGLELNDGREKLQPDGTATNCGEYGENEAAAKALGWIGRHFNVSGPRQHVFYNLYGIERAGRLSGQRFLGEHDWYREGCEYLARTQRDDGSWYIANQLFDNSPTVSTSFALLFLSKGRTPVLISKLAHGPGEDWNNDRNDARNLVEYVSRELFKKEPLAWQVFDARKVEVENHDQVLALAADLAQSPIAYFNGHQAPRFSGAQKDLLKAYVDQGGFILAEACCGRPEFDRGFRELMRELFPENALEPLELDHPIWRAHSVVSPPKDFQLLGIKLGCKTVVVYSPQDLSCLWEANQSTTGRGQFAFRLGANIVAYATGMEKPKARLTPVEVINDRGDERKVPRGYLKVAQLRHDGDWHPAPKAMRNLMLYLRQKAHLDVALQTEDLRPGHPDLLNFKFMYMHGRGAFSFEGQEIENLRANLETGAVLLADACCGRKAFDASFRALMKKLLPDKELEPIPLNDDLYSKELNGTAIKSVRRRDAADAGYRDVPPELEGIKVNGHWVVIYSKYDIGCALEHRLSSDCLGHDPESALKLASAAVLYALNR